MSSSMGQMFKVTTFGESHGIGVGAIVDGCPAGLALIESDIQPQLDRRRPGQSALSSPRDEKDIVQILSGVENGITLGTPIGLMVRNKDQQPGDYKGMSDVPRPSHADYTYQMKYGLRASSGGGRASAREAIGRVAAGAIAEKWLSEKYGIRITAWVSAVGNIEMPSVDPETIERAAVDANSVRCPDAEAAEKMTSAIEEAQKAKDSVGGVVTCCCAGVPAGWGEPVFHKLEAVLAQGMMSIPASKGFEIGSGFSCARMKGSEHNDLFVNKGKRLGTASNFSGGVQGGISNGEPIVLRIAFKPPATIGLPQKTVDFDGHETTLEAAGRHDPCVVSRAVPIVEGMAALILADAALQQNYRQ